MNTKTKMFKTVRILLLSPFYVAGLFWLLFCAFGGPIFLLRDNAPYSIPLFVLFIITICICAAIPFIEPIWNKK